MNTKKILSVHTAVILNIVCCLAIIIFPILFSNAKAINYNDNTKSDRFDKLDLADLFDIGSGVFAILLSALSLAAYRNLKSKRVLFVSAAFAMFAVHSIFSKTELFIPTIESSLLELIVSVVSFVSLSFFFLAIVKGPKTKAKTSAS